MSKFSLRMRLMIMGGAIMLGLLFVGGVGLYSTRNLTQELNEVLSNRMVLIKNLILIDMVHDGVRGAALEALAGSYQKEMESVKNAQNT